MAKENWIRVSRDRRCPVCEGADNCSVSRDGAAVWCGRIAEGSIRQNAGGQFFHVLRERDDSPTWPRRRDDPPMAPASWPKGSTNREPKSPTKDWGRIAKLASECAGAEAARQELATRLGVDADALRRLGVGWLGVTRGWSFPERDATGQIIGINRRLLNGQKRREQGGQAGLTFDPNTWLKSVIEPEFVFLVEGGSDTAALLTEGLSVVGRPNNTGGVELLAELLRAVPTDRIIVVVGEHDRKSFEALSLSQKTWHKPTCDGCSACWPGKYGAVTTASKLAVRLGRQIAWAFPPENAKDARAWLNSQPTDERIE